MMYTSLTFYPSYVISFLHLSKLRTNENSLKIQLSPKFNIFSLDKIIDYVRQLVLGSHGDTRRLEDVDYRARVANIFEENRLRSK